MLEAFGVEKYQRNVAHFGTGSQVVWTAAGHLKGT